MKIQQLYTGCLAEAAYYIACDGEAAIIDPLRETSTYLQLAEAQGDNIRYILETHFHADFVSGHLDLQHKTGATIVFGPTAQPAYPAHIAADGELLKLGRARIQVLHTPGHTMESCCFLLFDEAGVPQAIFTGDTLFIGDVGRPDLAVNDTCTREDLAGYLYDSLRRKIMVLPDEVVVYPGHGAGSACGKMMSNERVSTIGAQRRFNYALRPNLSREDFITAVTAGLVDPPQYFPKNAAMNKGGYRSVDQVLSQGLHPLDVQEFQVACDTLHPVVLDTRKKEAFAQGHIPHAVFIGIDDAFAPWVGALLTNIEQPIVFIADEGREAEVVTRLARVGYDHAIGYLRGGVEAWAAAGLALHTLPEITASAFAEGFAQHPEWQVLDVRKKSEYDTQHIAGGINFPLDFIHRNIASLDPQKQYYIHCAGGYRSVIAASIMRNYGITQVVNVVGGFKALQATGLPLTTLVPQQTAL